MTKSYYLLLFLILLLFINNYENYENIYESNKTLSDEPDDTQFYACRQDISSDNPDYPFTKYPNSNYRVKENQVRKPQKGTFSAFLDVHKIRTYDHFFHAPICEDDNESYDFNSNLASPFRRIPGAFPEEDKEEIYKEELEKDSHDLRNPFYLHSDPNYIQNKILYENEIQDIFLEIKLKQGQRHEDDRHLVNDHNYDI
tara:strand:+ start:353 stop:949 length:597 start_codon:yes stop_codon:yes gene_type:complete